MKKGSSRSVMVAPIGAAAAGEPLRPFRPSKALVSPDPPVEPGEEQVCLQRIRLARHRRRLAH
jgi:hypothetical protein